MRFLKRLWNPFSDAARRVWDPFTPPVGWEVLPEDWVAAGDNLRRTLGLPPYQGRARYPTVEEMEAWDRAYPGTAAQWRRCARIESEIRYLRGIRRRLPPVFRL